MFPTWPSLSYQIIMLGKPCAKLLYKLLLPWCFKWDLLRLIWVSVVLFEWSISELFFAMSSQSSSFQGFMFDTVISFFSFVRVSNISNWFGNLIWRTVLSQNGDLAWILCTWSDNAMPSRREGGEVRGGGGVKLQILGKPPQVYLIVITECLPPPLGPALVHGYF